MPMPFIRNRIQMIRLAGFCGRWLLVSVAFGCAVVWAQSQPAKGQKGIVDGLPVPIESEMAGAEREAVLRQLINKVNRQILEAVELADDVNSAYHTIRTIPTPPGSRSPEVLKQMINE